MRKVTAVLLNYKRPTELKHVERHVASFSFVDEIIVWNNAAGENLMMYGRFLAAKSARNSTIYVQDDDCIIQNLRSIYEAYDGTQFVNGMKPERARFYRGEDSLVGWGAFFEKDWIACLDRYTNRWGKDRIFYRECDRIFTCLVPKRRKTVDANVADFPSAMANFSLSLQQEHENTKALVIERCRQLGGRKIE